MPNIQRMLSAAGSIKQRYDDEFVLRATVRQTDQARAAAYLCLTICELFDATICLIENGFSSHSPILIRTMMEGMADLYLVVTDATHLDKMTFASAKSSTSSFNRMASFTERPEGTLPTDVLEAFAAASASELERLKRKGVQKQTIEEKLTKAGLGDAYSSYQLLCGYAHNDLKTLHGRHAGPDLRYHHEASPGVTFGMLTIAFNLLTEAVAVLPDFSNIPADELLSARKVMDAEWAKVTA